MRFLLGVLVGYILRGKQKLLIRFLVTLALVVYVVIPALALLMHHVHHGRMPV